MELFVSQIPYVQYMTIITICIFDYLQFCISMLQITKCLLYFTSKEYNFCFTLYLYFKLFPYTK